MAMRCATVSQEQSTALLDGTVRRSVPYRADLVLYHQSDGTPSSRFGLRPSAVARSLPVELGAEDVDVFPYDGETVVGGVIGASLALLLHDLAVFLVGAIIGVIIVGGLCAMVSDSMPPVLLLIIYAV